MEILVDIGRSRLDYGLLWTTVMLRKALQWNRMEQII